LKGHPGGPPDALGQHQTLDKEGADGPALKAILLIGVLIATTAPNALAAPPSSEPGFSRSTALDAVMNGTVTIDSTGSTKGKLAHGCAKSGYVVWFTWTADETAPIVATTAGSNYDTVLYVFEEHKLVGCNDNHAALTCFANLPNVCSEFDFQSENGKTCFFAVGAFAGGEFQGRPGGDTHLNLSD
jgi:hypothetical protein